ncbi:hypothetical protein BDQ17DRAFT_368418 [Cyathus striatus]|nr:hypothetical protein BDQ17DRAFT_368418 [Cyathus striatus]
MTGYIQSEISFPHFSLPMDSFEAHIGKYPLSRDVVINTTARELHRKFNEAARNVHELYEEHRHKRPNMLNKAYKLILPEGTPLPEPSLSVSLPTTSRAINSMTINRELRLELIPERN